jgi:hypothetical protein
MRTCLASMVLLLSLTACSGGGLEPGAGNDPGTQTGGLVVGGRVVATPLHANARASTEFMSDFLVVVQAGGGLASTGTVTVTSATGKVPLTFSDDGHLGYGQGSAAGYDEVYVLDVVTGANRLEGVRVDGPDIHVFSQPTEGAVVDPSTPLIFVWDRSERADSAMMKVDSSIIAYLADSGEHSLSPDVFALSEPHAVQHTVQLSRTNSVTLRAGTAWSATIVNEIDVVTPMAP